MEIEFLKENYKKIGPKYCSKILKKGEKHTQAKGKELGLSNNAKKWTENEVKFLKENYMNLTFNELSKRLDRTIGSIEGKLYSLKLERKNEPWTHEETTFLKNNYKKGIKFCMNNLNRSRYAIILKIETFNEKKVQLRAWRSILRRSLKRMKTPKNTSTHELLRYNANQLKQRIECQFLDGMSWDNYGDWHIDHIKPISKFNINTPVHIVNALCNLQPLWAKENLTKGNKF